MSAVDLDGVRKFADSAECNHCGATRPRRSECSCGNWVGESSHATNQSAIILAMADEIEALREVAKAARAYRNTIGLDSPLDVELEEKLRKAGY